jgi:hypothetical protein
MLKTFFNTNCYRVTGGQVCTHLSGGGWCNPFPPFTVDLNPGSSGDVFYRCSNDYATAEALQTKLTMVQLTVTDYKCDNPKSKKLRFTITNNRKSNRLARVIFTNRLTMILRSFSRESTLKSTISWRHFF